MQRVTDVEIVNIEIGQRLRPVDPDYATMLAASIEAQGLINPITVGPSGDGGRRRLIAGAHRLAACVRLGWVRVPALVLECDGAERRLTELSENLFRRELNPIDRARHFSELKALWETMHPDTKHGARGLKAIMALSQKPRVQGAMRGPLEENNDLQGVLAFNAMMAEKLGMSERTVKRLTFLYRGLCADVAETLSIWPIAGRQNELELLARRSAADQRRLLKHFTDPDRPALSVREADARDGIRKPQTLPPSAYDRLIIAWGRADTRSRRRFVKWLHACGHLDGLAQLPLAGLPAGDDDAPLPSNDPDFFDDAEDDDDGFYDTNPQAAPAVTGGSAARSANTDQGGAPEARDHGIRPEAGGPALVVTPGFGPGERRPAGTPMTPEFAELVRLARDDPAQQHLWAMYGHLLPEDADDAYDDSSERALKREWGAA